MSTPAREANAAVACLFVCLLTLAACGSPSTASHAGSQRPAPPTRASISPALARSVRSYHHYVDTELSALAAGTRAFAAAVGAGRLAQARRLYPEARVHYERVEPVAEIWGQLDLAIDGRRADFAGRSTFRGFHRLEQLLWATGGSAPHGAPDGAAGPGIGGLVTGSGADVATALVRDVTRLQSRARSASYTPLQLTSGATELLNEIEATKVTGEEEQYSHLDLVDIAANVDGAAEVVELLTGYLDVHAPHLLNTLHEGLAAVRGQLATFRANPGADGSGYVSYASVPTARRRELSARVEALAQAVSLTSAATNH